MMRLPTWWGLVASAAIVLAGAVFAVSPANLTVLLYKLLLLSVAVCASVVIDRLFFKAEDKAKSSAPVARAVVFAGVCLGLMLGL